MKNTIKNSLKALLVAFMIMALPGFNKTVDAEEKELEEGAVYKLGDTIVLTGDKWILVDDDTNPLYRCIKQIKKDSYSLPGSLNADDDYYEGSGQWGFKNLFSDVGGVYLSLNVGFGTGTSASKVPAGIKCNGGTGTETDPFTFELIYETSYSVTLSGGANAATSGGATTQTGLTGAMETVTYTADTNYHFAEFSPNPIASNGVSATRSDDGTKVTVSGTPTAAVSMTIPDAVADAQPSTEKLSTPTNLHWYFFSINGFQARWDPIEELGIEDGKVEAYKVFAKCGASQDELTKKTDEISVYDGAYDFKDFFNTNKGGYYSFSVQAIAKEGSGMADSNVATLEAIKFSTLTINIVTKDKNGNIITPNIDTGGDAFVCYGRDGKAQNDGAVLLMPYSKYEIQARRNTGYVFEGFSFDTDPADLVKNGNSSSFTLDKNYEVTLTFKADDTTTDLEFDFCSGHENLAQQVCQSINDTKPSSCSVKGSVLTLRWIIADEMGGPSALVENTINNILGETYRDGDDMFYLTVGSKPLSQYENHDEYLSDYSSYRTTEIASYITRSDPKSYVHWLKPTDVVVEIEPLLCGTVVTVDETVDEETGRIVPSGSPTPNIVVKSGKAQIRVSNFNFWQVKDGERIVTFRGLVEVGHEYIAFLNFETDFGYYIRSIDAPKGEVTSTYTDRYITIKAEHRYVFDKIVWSKDANSGALVAKAVFKCENNDLENDAEVLCEINTTDSKKYVATLSAENSLDGQAHTDSLVRSWNLYVQGVHVNGDNCDDILGNGTVTFDPVNAVLTLNNANIEMKQCGGNTQYEFGIRSELSKAEDVLGAEAIDKGLTVNLTGNNTIKNSEAQTGTIHNYSIGLYGKEDSEITGSGKLNIEFAHSGTSSRGIDTESKTTTISVKEININITGTDDINGIHVIGSSQGNGKSINFKSGSNAFIHTGDRYALYAGDYDTINVEEGAIVEAICDLNKAVSNKLSETTKQLGAFVNTDPSNEGVELWNKTTNLEVYKYVYIPGELKYFVTEGDGQSWFKGDGTGASFRFKANVNDSETYSNFLVASVGGVALKEEDYTKGTGSVVITLKPSYLGSLSLGDHTLTVSFAGGATATAKFTISEKAKPSTPDYIPPRTGIE